MATLDTYKSDVVLGKVQSSDLGYSVEEVTVLWDDATTGTDGAMGMGAALYNNAGVYTWAAAANVGDVVACLVDPQAEAYDGVPLVGGQQYTMVVALRGHTIAQDKFTLAGTTTGANKTAAIAAFEAAGMNKVTDKVLG